MQNVKTQNELKRAIESKDWDLAFQVATREPIGSDESYALLTVLECDLRKIIVTEKCGNDILMIPTMLQVVTDCLTEHYAEAS